MRSRVAERPSLWRALGQHRGVAAWASAAALVGLASCTAEPGPGISRSRRAPAGTPVADRTAAAALPSPTASASGGVGASPGPTGPPSPGSQADLGGTPAPSPSTAIAVTGITLIGSPGILYLPPSDASASLGLPTAIQLAGHALLADGTKGGIRWSDRSGGHLSVSSQGAISTSATTSPGVHLVRAQAVSDPNVYRDVPIEVRSTGQLDVLLR